MKKILYFIAALSVAALLFSCDKDKKGKIDDEDAVKIEWRGRIDRLADAWDHWDFTYNENGAITKVDRDEGDKIWNFDWTGNTNISSNAAISGQDEMTISTNDKGAITKLVNGEDTYTYTYDANGFMTEAKKNGTVYTRITVEGGNVTKVVDYNENENTLEFEYGTEDNAEGFMLHWYDQYIKKGYPSWHRFLVEGGLFGKGPAKRPVSVKINDVQHDIIYDAPAIADGFEVLGWYVDGLTEWDVEVHHYMQAHK